MQGMMLDAREQMQRQGILQDTLEFLNPVKFLSDKNKLAQQAHIARIEKYATELHKKNRGRLSQEDVLSIQWEVEKFQEWQARAQQGMEQLAKAEAVMKQAPDGTYDMPFFASGLRHTIETGEPAPGGYLKIAPHDYLKAAEKVKVPNEEGFKTIRENNVFTKDGMRDVRTEVTEYGILNSDGTAIDREATEKLKDTIAWNVLLSSPNYMQNASDMFKALEERDPEAFAFYQEKASEYKMDAQVQGVQDATTGKPRTYPPEVNAAYLYAVDKFKERMWGSEVVDKSELEPDTLRAARFREAHKEKEEEKIVQKPTKYKDSDGNFLRMDITDRNGFSGNVAIAGGSALSRKRVNHNTEYYNAKSLITPAEPPKGRTYTVDENTTFIAMPVYSEEQWNNNYLGTNARVWDEKIGQTFKINSYSIHEGMPVYTGDKTLEIPAYVLDKEKGWVEASRKRKYLIGKNTPLTGAMEHSFLEEFGPNWAEELDVDELDVVALNVIGGQDEQTAQSSRMAAVLDTKVKRELGIDDSTPEAKKLVYEFGGQDYSREQLINLLIDNGYSRQEAEAEVDNAAKNDQITIK
jgi:hypothetical protein